MKIEAIYYHEKYDPFAERDGQNKEKPYLEHLTVPDDWTVEQIKSEANKSAFLKDGYRLIQLNKYVWTGRFLLSINILTSKSSNKQDGKKRD